MVGEHYHDGNNFQSMISLTKILNCFILYLCITYSHMELFISAIFFISARVFEFVHFKKSVFCRKPLLGKTIIQTGALIYDP